MIGIVVDEGPFFFRNAPGKPVRVVSRTAGHGQDGARIGVDGDGSDAVGADAVGDLAVHGPFRSLLQVEVDGQVHIVTGYGVLAFHFLDRTAAASTST